VLERQWARARHLDRTYLDRNVRLEPAQAPDAAAVVAAGLAQTERAWRRREPAVVETHRVNFAHAEPALAAAGRRALGAYLAGLSGTDDRRPVFLVSAEVAALARRGTSVRETGGRPILRNGTHARRLAALPATGGEAPRQVRVWLLDGGFHGAAEPSGRR
jgi:hypothetical protein